MDLFHRSTAGDTASVNNWLDDIGFGPPMGLNDPRRYWALYWLEATRTSIAADHGEQVAEEYFCHLRASWEKVDIDAVFESHDFAMEVMVPHPASLASALELDDGDSSAGSGASDY